MREQSLSSHRPLCTSHDQSFASQNILADVCGHAYAYACMHADLGLGRIHLNN